MLYNGYMFLKRSLKYTRQKNAFEWGSSEIPHSEDAIQVTQHAANYLVRLVLYWSMLESIIKRIM